jgi:hypothetical protein
MRLTTLVTAPVRLLVLCIVAFAAAPALAAPIDDAKAAFAEGKTAFERGDYETALSAYQRANMILPAPNLYYNIGATYERLGRYQEAALAFDKYFELAGTPTTDDEKEFQDKLRARAETDRHKPNLPPQHTTTPAPVQQPPPPPPGATPQPYYFAPTWNPGPTLEARTRAAKARRTRAIVLMAIGVPLTIAGIGLTADGGVNVGSDPWARGFEIWGGATAVIIGITLWAPGASSFVQASHDLKDLGAQTTTSPRGF